MSQSFKLRSVGAFTYLGKADESSGQGLRNDKLAPPTEY